MSSTFPHMTGLSASLNSSYAQQSNLEALIARSIASHDHTHHHPAHDSTAAGGSGDRERRLSSSSSHHAASSTRRRRSTGAHSSAGSAAAATAAGLALTPAVIRPKPKKRPTTVQEDEDESSSAARAADTSALEEEEEDEAAELDLGSEFEGSSEMDQEEELAARDAELLARLTTITGGGGHQSRPSDSLDVDDELEANETGASLSDRSPLLSHPADRERRSRGSVSASFTSPRSRRQSTASRRSSRLAAGGFAGFTVADVGRAQAESLGGARMQEPMREQDYAALLGDEEDGGYRGEVGGGDTAHMLVDPAEVLDAADLDLPVDSDGRPLDPASGTDAFPSSATILAELRILVRTALPVFFTQVAEYSLVLASVISIGHLGTTDLAASSLGSMTSSVTCFAILQGMSSALDTLLPAAWTSDDPTRVGVWTQRMCVVTSVAILPMYFVWWNAEPLLLFLRQEPEVAAKASLYLRYLSVGIPGYALNIIMRKYFQSQNLLTAPTIVIAIVAPLNAILNWLLVWGPKSIRLGFVGAPLATAISFNMAALVSLTYASFFAPKTAWGGFSRREAFSKLGTVTSLGLAGTIMVCSEWFAWEAIALATSLLGPVALAAQSILLSTASILFQVPQAMGIATAVRVGNLLGAGRPYEARLAALLAVGMAILASLFNSFLLIFFRRQIALVFNTDPEVVATVMSLAVSAAAFQVADGVVGATGGTLRAVGKQSAGALINLTAYYVFGLPLGLWLCFQGGYGLQGLWAGLSFSLFYAAAFIIWIVTRLDWPHAVVRARTRLGLSPFPEAGKDEAVPVNYGTMGGH